MEILVQAEIMRMKAEHSILMRKAARQVFIIGVFIVAIVFCEWVYRR